MIRRGLKTAVISSIAILLLFEISPAQDTPIIDSLKTEAVAGDSLLLSPVEDSMRVDADSSDVMVDSLAMLFDSLTAATEPEPPLPPPIRLIDSLAEYFSGIVHEHDVNRGDLYPQNAAGYLAGEASYFLQTYYEWPFRTTVAPFGLSSGQINVQAGPNEIHPYDRAVPADGRTDFNDIRTGDIVSGRLIEGPLSAYSSLDGGLAMLYLEPFPIPEGVARSEFTVERGAYGYAYTRVRFGRMFSSDFGLAFSTDYRTADGLFLAADDDMYYLTGRVLKKYGRKTSINFYMNSYRRKGGYPVEPDSGGVTFRRYRRDNQFVVSMTRQEFAGGQLVGTFQQQLSKSSYSQTSGTFYRTIKPIDRFVEIAFIRPSGRALYELSIRAGKEQYDLDLLYKRRYYGAASFSAMIGGPGGQLFAFGRARKAEGLDAAIEGAVGLAGNLTSRWKAILSFGLTRKWPGLDDLYATERADIIGSTGALSGLYTESGNPDLAVEKRLTGNATISYITSRATVKLSANVGQLDDLIYYDRQYGTSSGLTVVPENDNGTFADLNLTCSIDTLGPFFATVSASGRRVETDRWGNRPPYSPRWQVYGQLGLRYFLARYKVKLRLFGDIAYTEKPLSYQLEKLETTAPVTAGFNAALKDLTFYYMVQNLLDQSYAPSQGYSQAGWYYRWGINWKFFN